MSSHHFTNIILICLIGQLIINTWGKTSRKTKSVLWGKSLPIQFLVLEVIQCDLSRWCHTYAPIFQQKENAEFETSVQGMWLRMMTEQLLRCKKLYKKRRGTLQTCCLTLSNIHWKVWFICIRKLVRPVAILCCMESLYLHISVQQSTTWAHCWETKATASGLYLSGQKYEAITYPYQRRTPI